MTIETKYNIGDVVWFMHDNKVKSGTIIKIDVSLERDVNSQNVGKSVYYGSKKSYGLQPSMNPKFPLTTFSIGAHICKAQEKLYFTSLNMAAISTIKCISTLSSNWQHPTSATPACSSHKATHYVSAITSATKKGNSSALKHISLNP